MRVLITGGTGFIGKALASRLHARGDEVVVISRGAPGTVRWDDLETEVKRCEAVVHLAGESVADGRWTAERLERIRASRVETTTRVARAVAAGPERPRVLVSASAVGYYGMLGAEAPPLDERAPPGTDVLARVCVDWERAADPARAAGVRVVHPRIGVVLGVDGGMLAKMAPAFRWGVGGPLGRGDQWVSWIHQDDLLRAVLFAIDSAAIEGPMNAVAPEAVTMNELARAVGAVLHRPSGFRVPALALRAAFGEGLARMMLTGQRCVPRALEGAGFAFAFPPIEAALRDLLVGKTPAARAG